MSTLKQTRLGLSWRVLLTSPIIRRGVLTRFDRIPHLEVINPPGLKFLFARRQRHPVLQSCHQPLHPICSHVVPTNGLDYFSC